MLVSVACLRVDGRVDAFRCIGLKPQTLEIGCILFVSHRAQSHNVLSEGGVVHRKSQGRPRALLEYPLSSLVQTGQDIKIF